MNQDMQRTWNQSETDTGSGQQSGHQALGFFSQRQANIMTMYVIDYFDQMSTLFFSQKAYSTLVLVCSLRYAYPNTICKIQIQNPYQFLHGLFVDIILLKYMARGGLCARCWGVIARLLSAQNLESGHDPSCLPLDLLSAGHSVPVNDPWDDPILLCFIAKWVSPDRPEYWKWTLNRYLKQQGIWGFSIFRLLSHLSWIFRLFIYLWSVASVSNWPSVHCCRTDGLKR